MTDYVLTYKTGNTGDNKQDWKKMITFGLSKNGYLQCSFTPEFRPVLIDWLKNGEGKWLNFNVKSWDNGQPSSHDQAKQNGYQVDDNIPY